MQQNHLSHAPKAAIKKREERRRRERDQRDSEYRRRIEQLRRQLEEARKRRKRLLLLFLLAMLTALKSTWPIFYFRNDWPDADPAPVPPRNPDPSRGSGAAAILEWSPDPANDFAPQPGSDNFCDGYSRENWQRMTDERGIQLSRKDEMKAEWKRDPTREDFPARYKNWGYKPFVGEIMRDLSDARWRTDALAAIKLLAPAETHKYLDESYVTDPGDLRQCLADRDHQIVAAFQQRAVLWEERKRREAENAKRDKEFSRKIDDEQGTSAPK